MTDVSTSLSQVVETSINVISNRVSQDYTHLDDHTSPTNNIQSNQVLASSKLDLHTDEGSARICTQLLVKCNTIILWIQNRVGS